MLTNLRGLSLASGLRAPHVAWLSLAVFGAVAGVIALAAVIIGVHLQEGIRKQGKDGAEAAADAFVAGRFDARDFHDGRLTPPAEAELSRAIFRSTSIDSLRLWSAEYELVYVSHRSMRLRRPSQPSEEFLAARLGKPESEITSLADEEATSDPSGGGAEESLIEVYRPVRVQGDDGIPFVVETYVPYSYVGSRIDRELRSLYLLLAGAVLLINIALFPTLRRAARAVRENRERRHPELQRRLRRAMERDELVLHYQPKVDLHSSRIVGAEALLRWRAGDGSLRAPGTFLPQAEETEIIGPLTMHVAARAMQQCARWRAEGIDIPVSINLSSSNLSDPQLPDRLSELARRRDVSPSMIKLEVTETSAMTDPVQAVEQLTRLYVLGFRLSIDDFGAGESSLSRLDQIPFCELKIDRSLISPLEAAHNPALVKTIISLGHQLGMTVVAEGVEQEDTPALLRGLGCDQAQGYLFGRPMEPYALAAMVHANRVSSSGPAAHAAEVAEAGSLVTA
jgi:EAL domain-containing protein (putative c-di-GMP-specific phosphodiesterase class I)